MSLCHESIVDEWPAAEIPPLSSVSTESGILATRFSRWVQLFRGIVIPPGEIGGTAADGTFLQDRKFTDT
jgi:hypothetical protein